VSRCVEAHAGTKRCRQTTPAAETDYKYHHQHHRPRHHSVLAECRHHESVAAGFSGDRGASAHLSNDDVVSTHYR